MAAAEEDKPTLATYISSLSRVCFTTVVYWLVGLTPEENHWRKAVAWMEIDGYRFAAWHWRKYLKYSEDSRARASLGWCYAKLDLVEPAAEHYRLAYSRNKDPEIALYLAQIELGLGNLAAARSLVKEILFRREALCDESVATLSDIQASLSEADDVRSDND